MCLQSALKLTCVFPYPDTDQILLAGVNGVKVSHGKTNQVGHSETKVRYQVYKEQLSVCKCTVGEVVAEASAVVVTHN